MFGIDYNDVTGCITDYSTTRGFPLGGFGTGGFNILTDGGFGFFRTNHNWFRFIKQTKFPKGTFLAARVENAEGIQSRILRGHYRGGTEFKNIQSIAHTKFIGKLPHFNLEYEDETFPLSIKVTGFTSIIPRKACDSTLPAAFFQCSLQNPSDQPITASILFAFENILGLGGSGGNHFILIRDGPVAYKSTKGNYAEDFDTENAEGVCFKTKQDAKPNDPYRRVLGEYLVITPKNQEATDQEITRCSGWSSQESKPELLNHFLKFGELSRLTPKVNSNAGAVCVKTQLTPGQTVTIDFIVIWWTPYYVLEKDQRIRKIFGRHAGIDYGHYYLNFYKDSASLAEYCIQERKRLAMESSELQEILEHSSLSPWLQREILNSFDSMLVNTCVTRDGKYYMIEGCPWDWIYGGLTGTLDQRLASHPYSSIFFPELDQTELETFRDLTRNGKVPHGNGSCDIALGTDDIPYGKPLKFFNKTENWIDLPQSFILQVGKLFILKADWQLLEASWPKMIEMVHYLESTSKEHIPDGITTYDYMYYHPYFIYSAFLQISTLQMIIYLGNQIKAHPNQINVTLDNIDPLLEYCNTEIIACRATIEQKLWNPVGFYRICEGRNNIFTSALAGDWIARYCGMDAVVEFDKAVSHSQWQFRVLMDSHDHLIRNRKRVRPLIYREATPEGQEVPAIFNKRKHFQVNNPWQTLAYQGFEAIYLGRVQEGLNLIKRIWEKGNYEGYPWDMDHWGSPGHIYMTHPTMWAIFNALTGASLDLINHTMTLSPRLIPEVEQFHIPVFFPTIWFWITYELSSRNVEIEVIKSFDETQRIQTVLCRDLRGEQTPITLDPEFELIVGKQITIQFPYEFSE